MVGACRAKSRLAARPKEQDAKAKMAPAEAGSEELQIGREQGGVECCIGSGK